MEIGNYLVYFYIFDHYTDKPRFAKETDLIKLKLADLEIITDKAKATPIRQVEILAREAIAAKKYKNIVAVGNDKTAFFIINEILKSKENITFGFIPLGPSKIAEICGLPQGVAACEAISARKLETIDVGKLDYLFFLATLEIYPQKKEQKTPWQNLIEKFIVPKTAPEVEIEFREEGVAVNQFKISAPIEKIIVANLLPENFQKEIAKYHKNLKIKVSPHDGLLDIFVFARQKNQKTSLSCFHAKTIHLKSRKPLLCLIDGQKSKRVSGFVGTKPRALSLIVGKNRQF